jgi:uncharacterized protein (TIRG00374 family)
MTRRGASKLAVRAFGPVILIIILCRVDLKLLSESVSHASFFHLVAAYLLIIPPLLFRVMRWRILLSTQKIPLNFMEALNIYSFSIFAGIATPGRIGEFIKVLHIRQKGGPLGFSILSVILDRLIDIAFIFPFSLWSFSVFFSINARLYLFLALLAACTAGLWLLVHLSFKRESQKFIYEKMIPSKLKNRSVSGSVEFSADLRKLGIGPLLKGVGFTALAWGMYYGSAYMMNLALGLGVPFIDMFCIAAATSLVSIVPVSVMGLGTRDMVLIVLLAKYGINETQAVALSVLMLSTLLFNALVCSYSIFTSATELKWKERDPGTGKGTIS